MLPTPGTWFIGVYRERGLDYDTTPVWDQGDRNLEPSRTLAEDLLDFELEIKLLLVGDACDQQPPQTPTPETTIEYDEASSEEIGPLTWRWVVVLAIVVCGGVVSVVSLAILIMLVRRKALARQRRAAQSQQIPVDDFVS